MKSLLMLIDRTMNPYRLRYGDSAKTTVLGSSSMFGGRQTNKREGKMFVGRPVVVAQMVERSLPTRDR